jgi:hypothetical protein
MPIRFACPNCHQLLGVSERKAGSAVKCPKCATEVAVPQAEEAGAPPAMRRFEHPEVEEAINRLVVFDRTAVDDAPPGKLAATPGRLIGHDQSMLLIPRKVIYFQAGLLSLTALLFFLAGWWIGSSGAPANTPNSNPQNEPATVDVLLHYRDATGELRPDDGAVVLLLPADKRVIDKLPAAPWDPVRPILSAADPIRQRLQLLGGVYGRTNGDGKLAALKVPESGEYHVLLLANHARRQGEARPQDLATLGTYLDGAAELLANRDYRLTTEDLRGPTSVAHQFGEK